MLPKRSQQSSSPKRSMTPRRRNGLVASPRRRSASRGARGASYVDTCSPDRRPAQDRVVWITAAAGRDAADWKPTLRHLAAAPATNAAEAPTAPAAQTAATTAKNAAQP